MNDRDSWLCLLVALWMGFCGLVGCVTPEKHRSDLNKKYLEGYRQCQADQQNKLLFQYRKKTEKVLDDGAR